MDNWYNVHTAQIYLLLWGPKSLTFLDQWNPVEKVVNLCQIHTIISELGADGLICITYNASLIFIISIKCCRLVFILGAISKIIYTSFSCMERESHVCDFIHCQRWKLHPVFTPIKQCFPWLPGQYLYTSIWFWIQVVSKN